MGDDDKKVTEELRYLHRVAELRSDIVNILATARDEDMYFEVLDLLREFFQSPYGLFGYIDENGSLICPSMTRHIWQQCQMENKTVAFPRESWGGLWGEVLLGKESKFKNSLHRVPHGHISLYRSMGAPILHQGELIGLIHLANRPWDYDQEDVEELENIVTFIAPVLHARLQRDREERERSRLESQLRQAQKMDAIGTLAGGIAHDFNNILATMLGYTELLLDKIPEHSEEGEYLQQILQAEERATKLVSQILAFSRTEQHNLTPLKIAPLVKEALKMIRAVLPATVEIRHRIDPRCPPILASATQIHQVLINLCTNASHAMREQGGVLEIRLEQVRYTAEQCPAAELLPGNYLKLTVSDTGSGMMAEIKDRIFDPFFTTKNPGEGTGLGLSVVHGIVKNHQGVITVESTPGQGSIFQIFFPVVEESEDATKAHDSRLSAIGGDERILVVEDETALADFYRVYLTTLGYRVTVVGNGDEALRIFRVQPENFDLIFTDQTMPGMTGLQLSRELLRIRSNVPIILATGHSDGVSEKTALSQGIRRFLTKPVKIGMLTHAIRESMNT